MNKGSSAPIGSQGQSSGTVAPSSLTFTSTDWATPQYVIVTGVDDFLLDGNRSYSVITGAANGGSDDDYDGLDPDDVSAINANN